MNSLHVAIVVLALALAALLGLGVHALNEHMSQPINSSSDYDVETGAYSVEVWRG